MPEIEQPKDAAPQSPNTADVNAPIFNERVMAVLVDMNTQMHLGLRIGAEDYLHDRLDQSDTEEDKKQCPTGGCPPDDKLTRDVYWLDMAKESVKSKLDWRIPEQRKQLHFNILDSFRNKHRQNDTYKEQDRVGPPTSEGPGFEIKDGRLYYPDSGVYLDELYDNQKLLRPEQYDPIEHASMRIMQEALAKGATYARIAGYNKDKEGNYAIRDAYEMRLEDGKGTMKISNITSGNGHLTLKEAYDVMKQNGDPFIEGHPTEGIFIFTDAPIESDVVHEILDSVKISPAEMQYVSYESLNSDVIPYQETIIEPLHYSIEPVSERLLQLSEYVEIGISQKIDKWLQLIEERHVKNIVIPPFLQRLLGTPQEVLEQHVEVPFLEITVTDILTDAEHSSALQLLSETPKQNSDGSSLESQWKKIAEKALQLTPQQSESLLIKVQEGYEAMKAQRDTLILSMSGEASIAAAILMIKQLSLAENPTEIIDLSEFVSNTDSQLDHSSLEFVTSLSSEQKDVIFSFIEQTLEGKQSEDLIAELPQDVDIDNLMKTINFIKQLDAMPSEQRVNRIIQEKEKILKNISALLTGLGEIMARRKTEQQHDTDNNQHVDDFSTAMVMWMLMKVGAYYSNLEFIHKFIVNKDSMKHESEHETLSEGLLYKEDAQEIVQQEPSTWLLLAIIWQMAMIREQGFAQSNAQTHTKQKKKQKNTSPKIIPLPTFWIDQSRVIYAYGS